MNKKLVLSIALAAILIVAIIMLLSGNDSSDVIIAFALTGIPLASTATVPMQKNMLLN